MFRCNTPVTVRLGEEKEEEEEKKKELNSFCFGTAQKILNVGLSLAATLVHALGLRTTATETSFALTVITGHLQRLFPSNVHIQRTYSTCSRTFRSSPV